MSTNPRAASLAGRQRIDPQIAERRLRVALQAVIADPTAPSSQRTPTPEHFWHDNSRTEPRAPLVCEKERDMLAAAIAQGCTTELQIVRYYLARLADTLAEFPDAPRVSDACYILYAAEHAEAIERAAIARALPTQENRETAIREIEEANLAGRAFCGALARGDFVRPMGVAR